MSSGFNKFIASATVAGLVAVALLAATTPASAWGRHGHGGYYRGGGGGWWGPAAALGVFGAAVGAAAAQPYYYDYPACRVVRQPIVDEWGNFLYYRRVRYCD